MTSCTTRFDARHEVRVRVKAIVEPSIGRHLSKRLIIRPLPAVACPSCSIRTRKPSSSEYKADANRCIGDRLRQPTPPSETLQKTSSPLSNPRPAVACPSCSICTRKHVEYLISFGQHVDYTNSFSQHVKFMTSLSQRVNHVIPISQHAKQMTSFSQNVDYMTSFTTGFRCTPPRARPSQGRRRCSICSRDRLRVGWLAAAEPSWWYDNNLID